MSDGDNEDYELAILQLAENAIIADSVTPESSQIGLQRFADRSGVAPSDSLIEITDNVCLRLSAQFLELFQSPRIEPISPIHASLPGRNTFCQAGLTFRARDKYLQGLPNVEGWPHGRR